MANAGHLRGQCSVRLHLHLQAARFRVLKPDGRSHGDRCYTCFVDLAVYSRFGAAACLGLSNLGSGLIAGYTQHTSLCIPLQGI